MNVARVPIPYYVLSANRVCVCACAFVCVIRGPLWASDIV